MAKTDNLCQKMPSITSVVTQMKIVNVLTILVHTTSCPASSSSAPISFAMIADDTATGVANTPTYAAKCSPEGARTFRSMNAAESPSNGTATVLAKVPKMISFRSFETLENSNLPPSTISANGVHIDFMFSRDL